MSRKISSLDFLIGIILICFILPDLFKSSKPAKSTKKIVINWASVIAYSIIGSTILGAIVYQQIK